ncbi:hypothetical protein ACTMTI_55540 [Nonomuraea sp. H19]|uniref:hypothetical protein n=1 Tax=Nonomuraea sp. H19 TaxID=3452206 RepID=UPI003F8B9A1C
MSGLEEWSREELIALAGRVGALEKENGELRERVARLERLISRNGGNSGMSSSGDDLLGKPQPKAKPAKGGAPASNPARRARIWPGRTIQTSVC